MPRGSINIAPWVLLVSVLVPVSGGLDNMYQVNPYVVAMYTKDRFLGTHILEIAYLMGNFSAWNQESFEMLEHEPCMSSESEGVVGSLTSAEVLSNANSDEFNRTSSQSKEIHEKITNSKTISTDVPSNGKVCPR